MTKSKIAAMSVYPRLKNSDDRGSAYSLNVEFNEFKVERETLVLLHGYMGSVEDFDPAFDILVDKYNLIAIDLRAHGRSKYPKDKNASWQVQDLAEDIAQVVDYVAPETKFSVVASSMATAIALDLARLYPEMVDRLFLMSPTSKFTIPGWIKLIFGIGKISTAKFLEGLIDTIGNIIAKMASEQEKEFWEKGLDKFNQIDIDIHKKIFNETLAEWEFEEIGMQIPVLMVAGKDDNIIPHEDTRHLLDILPNSSLLTLKDTKHHIVQDKKEIIFDLIVQWMDETDEILKQQLYFDEHIVQDNNLSYHLMLDQFTEKTRAEVKI